MKVKLILLVLFFVGVSAWAYRVYNVNKGVALKYDLATYQMGDWISDEKLTFMITELSYGEIEGDGDYSFVPATVKMEVKNISDENISVSKLIESKLSYGMDYYQTMDGEFDVKQVKELPPNKTIPITLLYSVAPEYKDKAAQFYIDQNLYTEKVKEQFKHGKRYGIVVDL
jgi:hypothetical protein